jgi:hypothetical protein
VILPSDTKWNLADFITQFNAKKVEQGFNYNSAQNSSWETVEGLRELIKIHVDPTFLV